MIVEGPKTLEDFKEVRKTLNELYTNPYMHEAACDRLLIRMHETELKIKELENDEQNEKNCGNVWYVGSDVNEQSNGIARTIIQRRKRRT